VGEEQEILGDERLRELALFEEYLLKRRDRATVRKYVPSVRRFLAWLGDRRPGSLSRGELERYIEDVWYDDFFERYGRRPAAATQRAHVTALKAFYRFLESRELLVDESGNEVRDRMALVDSPRREQRPIDYLSREDDDALLAYEGEPHEELIVWLLRETGIRIGELRGLLVGDVDLRWVGRETIRIRESKTLAGRRTIPLSPELALRLRRWLEHLKSQGLYRIDGPVLPTRRGTPAHTQWIDRVLKRVAGQAGVRRTPCTCGTTTVFGHAPRCPRTVSGDRRSEVSAHTLRRTYATALLNDGAPIKVVSKLLGHTSVAITQAAYAELLDDRVWDGWNRARGYRVAA
jgi:integrase